MTLNTTVSFFFGASTTGNALGGVMATTASGQFVPSVCTVGCTRLINTTMLVMVSVCGLRFWMLTFVVLATLGVVALSVIFFGALSVTTAKSCGTGGASCTMTLKLQVLVLADESMTVQMTGLVPRL